MGDHFSLSAPAAPLTIHARFTPVAFWEPRLEHAWFFCRDVAASAGSRGNPCAVADGFIDHAAVLSAHEEGADDDGGGDAEEEDEGCCWVRGYRVLVLGRVGGSRKQT